MTRKTMLGAVALAALGASIAGPVAAAAPTLDATVADRTLSVSGGPLPEQIALRLSLDRTQLQVDLGDDGSADHAFDLATFDASMSI